MQTHIISYHRPSLVTFSVVGSRLLVLLDEDSREQGAQGNNSSRSHPFAFTEPTNHRHNPCLKTTEPTGTHARLQITKANPSTVRLNNRGVGDPAQGAANSGRPLAGFGVEARCLEILEVSKVHCPHGLSGRSG